MSMLSKPDYIDIDGDGNKTEPMKEAAKQAKERDGMAKGGKPDERLQYGIGGMLRKLIAKVKANQGLFFFNSISFLSMDLILAFEPFFINLKSTFDETTNLSITVPSSSVNILAS